jgi:hypothetical protein
LAITTFDSEKTKRKNIKKLETKIKMNKKVPEEELAIEVGDLDSVHVYDLKIFETRESQVF